MATRGQFPPRTKAATVQRIHVIRTAHAIPDMHKVFPRAQRVHKANSISTRKSFRTYTEGQCVLARRGVSSNLARFM